MITITRNLKCGLFNETLILIFVIKYVSRSVYKQEKFNMASTSSLSEKFMDIHLGQSTIKPSSSAPIQPPPYSKDDLVANSNQADSTAIPKESEPTPSNLAAAPSAPPLERLSPAALLTENIDLTGVHPEGPPPSYDDSVCVTQPKRSPTPIPTVSVNVTSPPLDERWRQGGAGGAQPNTDTDCCEDLYLACQICYCALECCRCCLLCLSLLEAFK